jgi:hypothetical protein
LGFAGLLIKKRFGKPAAVMVPGADKQNLLLGWEPGFWNTGVD